LAQSTLERALEADPDGARGYVALAKYHLVVGDPDAAEEMSRAGLEKHPENPTLNLMLASLLELGQDYDGAIEVYEKMLTDDPHSTVAANNLASLLSEHRADPASLDRAYEIAMRFRTSEVPQFLDTLGWIYHLRGENPMALGLLKVAADRLGDVGPVQFHLGMTLKALDQSELAVASLSKSIALAGDADQPYVAKARIALAELEAAQKQPEQPSN
jgi:tetratricopeptide (TPR) repeat protein